MKNSSIRMKLMVIFIAALFAANAWALPPQAEADRLLLKVKELMDAKDYASAVKNFDRVARLGVRLPETFNYHYGVALAGVGDWDSSLKTLNQYLTQGGSGGKFYKEALVLYTQAEAYAAFADPEMVLILPGSFEMGSTDGEADEKPVHRVTIAQAFALGKTEVTHGQWKAVMGNNPSHFGNCGDTCPVENVSWDDAQAFIQKLNAKTGKQYRLPSEAEWEYACRAGERHEYCGSNDIGSVAWYGAYSNPVGNSAKTTNPVATKQANAFGLYDMSGNVWEWVEDSHHADYNGAPADGSVWSGDGAKRALRGGSWINGSGGARAAFRNDSDPGERSGGVGFRVARTVP